MGNMKLTKDEENEEVCRKGNEKTHTVYMEDIMKIMQSCP